MATYVWNVQAGSPASYDLPADWLSVVVPPGPNDDIAIAAAGVAVTTGDINLGMSVGQSGTMLLSGPGTSLTAGGLGVGVFGTGALAITAGAALLTTGSGGVDAVGYEAGGIGAVTIDGAGSSWTSDAAFLNVGYEGTASLAVSNGGALSMAGYLAVDDASVTLSGAGSRIAALQGAAIDGGGGLLAVAAGATLATGDGTDHVGDMSGAGTVSVTGASALWTDNAEALVVADPLGASSLAIGGGGTVLVGQALQVGDAGMAGSIIVSAGGVLRLTAASQNIAFLAGLGTAAGSAGTIAVGGAGATFDTGGNPMLLGGLGAGTLAVGAGGTAFIGVSSDTRMDQAEAICLGEYAGSVGSLAVSGAGARLTVNGGGFAGSGGIGSVVVSGGGVLTVGDAAATAGGLGFSIGAGAPAPGTTQIISGGSGTLTVGSLGTLIERNGFSVGWHASTGSVAITGGGVLDFAGQMVISNGDTIVGAGNGSVTIGAGGTLTATGPTVADPLTTVLSIGQGAYGDGAAGTLAVSGAGACVNAGPYGIAVGDTSATDPTGGGGNGTLTVGAGATVTSGALAIGVAATSVGLVTVGALGSLAVAGTISVGAGGSGTLVVAAAGSLTDGAIAIGAGGTVALNGALPAPQTIAFTAASGLLQLDTPAPFAATVSGFQAGDTLSVGGVSGASVSVAISGANTTLSFGNGDVLTLTGAAMPAVIGLLESEEQSGAVSFIRFTGSAVTTLSLTVAQVMADQDALRRIATPYDLDLSSTGMRWAGPTIQSAALGASGLQIVQFADGQLDYGTTSIAAQVYRMFLSAEGRAPTTAENNQWTQALQSGTSLVSMAASLIGTAGFAAFYGAAPTPAQFAVLLYENVLGRAPDAPGLAGWTGALQGGLSYAQALVDFSECGEHVRHTLAGPQQGLWNPDSSAVAVELLYDTVAGKPPDPASLGAWTAALDDGALTLSQIAGTLCAGAAFQSAYGNLSNAAFITALYENTLHRVPDAPGFAGWVGALNGGLARTTVVLDFAECGEHARDDLANTLSSSAALPGVVTLGPVAASAAVVAAGLDALQAEVAEGAVTGISLTDAGTATIPITVAQLATDAGALHFISGSYWLNVGAVSVENAGSIVQADNLGATTSAAYVAFSDGRLVFSDSDPAAVIYRLYLSALGRVADPSGLAGWTGVLQGGTPLVAIAQDFIGCGEFARHYGTNLSDPAFVTLLYENVLGRAPDGTGLAADVAALGAGTSRAAMLVNFSESPEHIADTNSAIHAGIWDAW